jgi:hypothetical protein
MPETRETGSDLPHKYQKAVTDCKPHVAERTNSEPSTSRSITTSQTEGIIKVIVVNKPERTKLIDKSTS